MRRPGRRFVAGLVVTAAFAVAIPACGTTTAGVYNPSVTVCYRTIPTAKAAVHAGQARFVGVHQLPADRAARFLPSGNRAGHELDVSVCVVVFEGTFAGGQVEGAAPDQHGRYAVVLVTTNGLRVLISFVTDRLPRGLRGRLV